MSGVRLLIVDGVVVPVYASTEINQRYEKRRGATRYRMADGSLRQRRVWPATGAKIVTTISGNGVIPAGIGEDGDVNYDGPIVISCIAPRAVTTTSTSIALPASRRNDAGSLPFGRALLLNEVWVSTAVSMAGDIASITPVTGATQYQVVYFPQITVFADPPTEDKPGRGPSFGWTLTAEEI